MEESCAYCGEEILVDPIRRDERVFCCQDCLDAFSEDSFDYLDQQFEEH